MPENQSKNQTPASKGGEARRPPIVAVLGHVDHGKTTLLDYIRKSSYTRAASEGGEPRSVAEREAGGITQSIGAYEIIHVPHESQTGADQAQTNADKLPRTSASSPRESAFAEGRKITFIDTPGHEAFSKMRSRGATIADLAILVVAADEGVKPQTKESVQILTETKTPFIVAITKADKPNADIEKIKNELTGAGVLLEGYGGNISYLPVSAKTGEHVDELLDLILLAAELEHLTYNSAAPASGFVVETRLDRRRGLEATVIVTQGTLRQGDIIATPTAAGKIKILEDFMGKQVKELTPSSPALIIGFEKLPAVGETFTVGGETVPAITVARETVLPSEENALSLIVKAGDAGSLEALVEILKATEFGKPVRIIAQSVSDVVDNDVKLAISTKAMIIAYKSKTDKAAKNLAEVNRVLIVSSEIIYKLIETISEYVKREHIFLAAGELKVLAVFNQEKPERQVVGGKVTQGIFKNKALFEIMRGDSPVGTGRVLNLQQNKKDAREVGEGNEAGLLVSAEVLIKPDDLLTIKS